MAKQDDISISGAFVSYWKHIFDWQGRATRTELWFSLGAFFLLVCILAVLSMKGTAVLVSLVGIPALLSLTVRRLHDMGKSGRYLWKILLYSLLGIVVVLIGTALLFALLDAMHLNLPILQNIRSSIFLVGGFLIPNLIPFVLLGGIAPILGFFPSEKKDNQYGSY